MNDSNPRFSRGPARLFLRLLVPLALLAALPAASGQAVVPSTPAKPPARDETVLLNAFEVREDSDTSYGALNSNSITRFSTELDHMPVSADVFNEAFMK